MSAAVHNVTLSTTQHPEEVEVRLQSECELGRVVGPLEMGSILMQVNRFGVKPNLTNSVNGG